MNSRFPQDLPIPEKFLESQKYSVNLYKKNMFRFPVRSATRARASGATTTTNSWPIVTRSDARIHYAIMHYKYSERGNVYCGLLDV